MNISKIIFFLLSFAFAKQIVDAGSPSYLEVSTVPPSSTRSSTTDTPTCSQTFDLFDPNEMYLSSVCTIFVNINAASALEQCRSLGMTLFTITSFSEYDALMKKAADNYGTSLGSSLWISGIKIYGTYYDSNDNSKTIDTSFYTINTPIQLYGDCLQAGGTDTAFGIFTIDCTRENHSVFCKYSNQSSE